MTVEELLDIEAIRNLRMVYGHYYDGQDVDSLVDLFTDDAVCEFGPNFGGDWVGKAQIRENFEKWSLREGTPFEVMHATTNPMIRLLSEDSAHGRAYLLDLAEEQWQLEQDPDWWLAFKTWLADKVAALLHWFIERT